MTRNMLLDQDVMFFATHPDRQITIREPRSGEKEEDFVKLGFHILSRRRILVWKVPKGAKIGAGEILRIPFLKYADEEISDRDSVLLPILNEIMQDAAKDYGMERTKWR